jgi:hypothetical protein
MEQKQEPQKNKKTEIKDPVIILNTTDTTNGKIVNSVWAYKITKIGREKRDMVWQYYRHRRKLNVNDVIYKKYKDVKLIVIYSGDGKQHLKDGRTEEQKERDAKKMELGREMTKKKKIDRELRKEEELKRVKIRQEKQKRRKEKAKKKLEEQKDVVDI